MPTPVSIFRQRVTANVRIQRFDPARDRAPHFDVFTVEVEAGMTVLDVLQHIKDKSDSSLTFRSSCRSSICGCCAVRVNDKAVLACRTQVLPTMVATWQSSFTVAPLTPLPIIRDLVVDIDPVLERLARLHPYLMENPGRVSESLEMEALVSRQELKRFDRNTDCILCSCCYSNCSVRAVDATFAGPFALAKAFRFSADPRDGFGRPRMQAAQDHGLWSCAQCRKCMSVCPKATRPAVAIQRLRKMSIDDGIHNTPGSRRAKAYTSDVERFGQVNKPALPVAVNGPRGWDAVEANSRYLAAHGLEPSLTVPVLAGQRAVATLFRQVREVESKGRSAGHAAWWRSAAAKAGSEELPETGPSGTLMTKSPAASAEGASGKDGSHG